MGAKMPVRSKNKLVDRIVELGWVEDRGQLSKTKTRKKGTRKPREGEKGYLQRASDVDSAMEDSSSGSEEEGSDSDNDDDDDEPSTNSASNSLLAALTALETGC